ncbi:lachesin-like [Penaeus indicus]|uniref:lachesin-like n=1 Tax=Penaeus indicus TaxID=29960 RepID=UPI00300C677D
MSFVQPLCDEFHLHVVVFFTMLLVSGCCGQSFLPRFLGQVTNFTAAVGKTAELSCRVSNLTRYKVAWFHMDRKMLLTIHTTVVTRIPRFGVTRDDETTWTLHIDNVKQEDSGQYMCQINTEPMKKLIGYLDVVVPPVIVDDRSSRSSVIVQENGNVTLICQAEGNPEPRISWMREDKKQISLNKRRKVEKHEGSTLELKKVTRRDMGAYLCIASNGVPPSVSKRIELKVQFSPIVLLPNQLMSAPLGSSVWLECKTEAYPRAVTFWKHNQSMVMSTNKYKLEEYHEDDYTTTVKLTINELEPGDFGKYLCYSRNSFGENDGTVELHEMMTDKTRIKKVKHEGSEDLKVLEQFPVERDGNRGQNHVILDRDESGILPVGNTNIKKDAGKVGVEEKGKLGRDRGSAGIFTNIMSNNKGPVAVPTASLLLALALPCLYNRLVR